MGSDLCEYPRTATKKEMIQDCKRSDGSNSLVASAVARIRKHHSFRNPGPEEKAMQRLSAFRRSFRHWW